jgi:hypothetical protein
MLRSRDNFAEVSGVPGRPRQPDALDIAYLPLGAPPDSWQGILASPERCKIQRQLRSDDWE